MEDRIRTKKIEIQKIIDKAREYDLNYNAPKIAETYERYEELVEDVKGIEV